MECHTRFRRHRRNHHRHHNHRDVPYTQVLAGLVATPNDWISLTAEQENQRRTRPSHQPRHQEQRCRCMAKLRDGWLQT